MRSQSCIFALALFAGCASVLLSGCASVGAPSLKQQHPQFGQAIVSSLNEQFLLNLVRLRYRDVPYFLEIASVTSQETISGTASFGADVGFGGPDLAGKNLGRVGVGGTYARTPTVVFSPLQGEAFVRKMLTPISLPALLVLTQSGWSVGRVFDIVLDRLDSHVNASSATGPTPTGAPTYEKFHEIVLTLRRLQKNNLLQLGLDMQNGEQRLVMALTQTDPPDPDIEMLKSLFGVAAEQNEIVLVDDQIRLDRHKKTIRLRSILGMMFFLSHGITVPEEHQAGGWVTVTKKADATNFDWSALVGHLFAVKSSSSDPGDAYIKVKYRDYWFYITDDDLESKSTFMLLTQLFSLQAGSVQTAGPTLTLPLR